MIFLKRHVSFTLVLYSNRYGKVALINDLYINFTKCSPQNNYYNRTWCNEVLKKCVTVDQQIRKKDDCNLIDHNIVEHEKIHITYDVVYNNSNFPYNAYQPCNVCYTYDIKIYNYIKYKLLDIVITKIKYIKTNIAEHKVLCNKNINYNKILNISMHKLYSIL